MKQKHIIGLGYEKCGTTALNEILSNHSKFITPKVKETYFFSRYYEKGKSYYMSLYPSDLEENDQYKVDITPCYIRKDSTLKRIADYSNSETKFIICLRNQIVRAYSHYVHDLFIHRCLEIPTPDNEIDSSIPFYDRSFFDESERSNKYHFTSYYEQVKKVIDLFGRDRVLILYLEKDLSSPENLSHKISEFIQEDIQLKLNERSKNEGRFPIYYYSRDKPLTFFVNQKEYICEPGVLYLKKGNFVKSFSHVSENQVMEIIKASMRWTKFIPEKWLRREYKKEFMKDTRKLEKLLETDLSFWFDFRDIQY